MIDYKKIKKLRTQLENTKWKCKKSCFECCTRITMTELEKDKMDKLLLKKWFSAPPQGKGKDFCEYLDVEWKCSVYEERPIICRAFWTIDITGLQCTYNIKLREHNMKFIPKQLLEYMSSKNKINNNVKKEETLESIISKGVPSIVYHVATLLEVLKVLGKSEAPRKVENRIIKLEEAMEKLDDSLENYFPNVIVFDKSK